jgi:hypothetical protein
MTRSVLDGDHYRASQGYSDWKLQHLRQSSINLRQSLIDRCCWVLEDSFGKRPVSIGER